MKLVPTIDIPEQELEFTFVRSSGPGGQNINKVATAVQLRFDLRNSPSLPVEVKERLAKLAGIHMTRDGELVLIARRYRTQLQNRQAVIKRLAVLVEKALVGPKERHPTRPSTTSKRKRMDNKKRHGALKRNRQTKSVDDY
jgi:ribosome-associated protein